MVLRKEGWKIKDIAGHMMASESSVRIWLRAAREWIKEQIQKGVE